MRFDDETAEVFRSLPSSGPLFPYLRTVRAGDRSTEFHQRCVGLGIKGVSLHSYRYAWAERAKALGYPERWAQQALTQSSKAVHRAYTKKVEMRLPSLESYEPPQDKVIPFAQCNGEAPAQPAKPAAIG
jgi:integrase